jgi:hypothetical protein
MKIEKFLMDDGWTFVSEKYFLCTQLYYYYLSFVASHICTTEKKLSSSDKGSLFTVDKSSNDEVSDTSDDAPYIKAG